MDNSAALAKGTAKVRKLIEGHIADILCNVARQLVDNATDLRITLGSNMTGNTVNSYAAGVYVRGNLMSIVTSSGEIPRPLRKKLQKGQRFHAGNQRWDGETQENTFTAEVQTNASVEAERCLAFLKSHKPSPKGWTIVMCNGVEYASFQESMMGIDTLTRNFDSAQFIAELNFIPLPV